MPAGAAEKLSSEDQLAARAGGILERAFERAWNHPNSVDRNQKNFADQVASHLVADLEFDGYFGEAKWITDNPDAVTAADERARALLVPSDNLEP